MSINTGGRVSFNIGDLVQVIDLDGRISGLDYVIDQDRSDRRGQLQLIHKSSGTAKKIHHRRILPSDYQDGSAVVLESNNRYFAICPECGSSDEVSNSDVWACENCGDVPLYWLSDKPKFIKKIKPRTIKTPSMSTKQTIVDLTSLKELENCQLWTKKNIPFDHERIDVRAHVLIFDDGKEQRKYCFNTYNGTLGKKQKKLYTAEFIANTPIESKKIWFSIANKEKTIAKLVKEGYEKA